MTKWFFLWWLFSSSVVLAQNITRMEYFFDNDPGYGNGTSVVITPAVDVTANFTISLSALSTGYHKLYVRGKDQNAKWSLLDSKSVYVQNKIQGGTLPNVTRLEYFLDSDPGLGNANSIPITAASDITKNLTMNLAGIANGFHVLYVRAQDAVGSWSLVTWKNLFVQPYAQVGPQANISRVEYYVDADPGYGNGIPVSFTSSTDVSTNLVVDLGSIATGFHTLVTRAKSSTGRWSLISSKSFVAANTSSNIVGVKYYFFDGSVSTPIKTYNNFIPGLDVTINFNALLVGLLPSTSYEIHLVALNAAGQFSREVVQTFMTPSVICNIPSPTANNASRCDNGSITLSASGAGPAPASYSWFDVATGGAVLSNGPVFTPNLTASQTFYVNIIDGLGICESLRTPVTASVSVTPTAPVTTGAVTCVPATLTLTASGGSTGQYRWYTTSSGGAAISNETNSTYLTPVINASTTYYAAINNGLCESLRTPVLADFCNIADIKIYQGLSHNGDDKNDNWIIQYIDLLPETKNNHVTVFNRWGDVVFETTNYDNINHVFTGLNKSGGELPTGTYFYRIEYSSGRKTQTGYLSLKK